MPNTDLPVLVIHGFTTKKIANLPIHHSLRKADFQTYNVDIPGFNTQDIRLTGPLIAERVLEIKEKHQCEKILLVGVSMGGLIGLYYLRRLEGYKHIKKFVALGSPFEGAPIAEMLEMLPPLKDHAVTQMAADSDLLLEITHGDFEHVDITSIGAVGDTLVPQPMFHLEGAKNILSKNAMWPTGHYDLVLRPANHKLLIKELRN
jgi:triacylglycerol esterase/lipase EstA (alpha/beta hydrolase family)